MSLSSRERLRERMREQKRRWRSNSANRERERILQRERYAVLKKNSRPRKKHLPPKQWESYTNLQYKDMWSEEAYQKCIRQCNKEQYNFLIYVLVRLYTYYALPESKRPPPLDIIVQGSAGTGKSFLIQALYQTLIRTPLFSEACSVLKLALSAQGAVYITGDTLHHALRLQMNGTFVRPLTQETLDYYRPLYAPLRMVILDDVSTIGSNLFSRLDQQLRQLCHVPDKPFGNVHMIKFGDLQQLQPIRDTPIFYSEGWWTPQSTLYYELVECMRFSLDYEERLDRLTRNHFLEPDDVAFFQSRVRSFDEIPREAIILCFSSKDAEKYNMKRLQSRGTYCSCLARDVIYSESEKLRKRMMKRSQHLHRSQMANLESVLHLQRGARYQLTKTLDRSKGWMNGAIGTLHQIDQDEDGVVTRVWLQFSNSLAPIDRVSIRIDTCSTKTLAFYREQFPLMLAEAITAHKAQGATFPSIAIYMHGPFNRFQQYVAFSRVTQPQGLYILDQFRPRMKLASKQKYEEELERLQNMSRIPYDISAREENQDPYEFLMNLLQCGNRLSFHLSNRNISQEKEVVKLEEKPSFHVKPVIKCHS